MMTVLTPDLMLALCLLLPGSGAILIGAAGRSSRLRDAISILTAAALCGATLLLLAEYTAGGGARLQLLEIVQGLPVLFVAEPLGLIFAALASLLWFVITIYSIGYMRKNDEPYQTRFYICFAVAMVCVMGIAFAGNMITLFVFYELLTLSTWPLVAHYQTDAAISAGRVYLGVLLSTSILFLLPAMAWTWSVTGTLDFTQGGILAGKVDGPQAAILFALYVFGTGKAALMPFHRWLPAAMIAPTPVSAFFHAVAVVKAGVFTVLKVGVYIFGVGFLSSTNAGDWMVWAAFFSMIAASIIALRQDDLKAMLAYSTIAQLAYVTLGVALATAMSVTGGVIQLIAHALAKITLFMCAGAIYLASGKTKVSEMRGLGRVMPYTYGAIFLAALSIIGIPPSGGAMAKYFLALGSPETRHPLMTGLWLASSLLSAAYLLPILARGFLTPLPENSGLARQREAPLYCVIPAFFAAILSVLVYFKGPDIARFISPVFAL